ncbi:hypothetical protein C2R22_16130 [Salinigranum rubrum]|uniref:DUF8215 domain-containing protein n=1 Tax=Salinigranum rubrum TaxID=755307 RepID=A0A2I8VM28_9EURY|nr:hypothetical protein [Salinigranum rubrum]AUV82983.1 hypothetical protein C2R22_16130 [Salinigranum rubrum]
MSSRSDLVQTNDDQRLATGTEPATDSRIGRVGRWLWTSGYQGLAQVFLLSAPVLWLAFRSPRSGETVKSTALVLVVVTPLVVGAFREGLLTAGRPWPTITSARLSFAGGYWSIFRRGVLLNHTLGVGIYAGGAVGVLTGSLAAAVGVGLPLVLVGVALVPWLTPETPRATAGRVGYAVVALSLAFLVSAPLSGNPRFRTAPAAFALLALVSVVDLRPWRLLDERR